jgi:hypothetical protein
MDSARLAHKGDVDLCLVACGPIGHVIEKLTLEQIKLRTAPYYKLERSQR